MPPPADLTGLQLVFLGSFRPGLLQPSFLLNHQLLREGDIAQLEIETFLEDFVSFKLPWVHFISDRTRFTLGTTLASPMGEPLRDLAAAVLRAMPAVVQAIGLNSDRHFALGDVAMAHRLGHLLAPKDEYWSKVLKNPGLRSIAVRGDRTDGIKGYWTVKVEPSSKIEHGIYLNMNDHFEAEGERLAKEPLYLVDALIGEWANCGARFQAIYEALQSYAKP